MTRTNKIAALNGQVKADLNAAGAAVAETLAEMAGFEISGALDYQYEAQCTALAARATRLAALAGYFASVAPEVNSNLGDLVAPPPVDE